MNAHLASGLCYDTMSNRLAVHADLSLSSSLAPFTVVSFRNDHAVTGDAALNLNTYCQSIRRRWHRRCSNISIGSMDPQGELEVLFHHFETRESYGPNGTAVLNDCDVNDE